MLEPTETETKETIDDYIEAMVETNKAIKDPEIMEEMEQRKTFISGKKVNSKKGNARPCLIEKEDD